ncbi:MAG: hypothetical protein MZW92_43430 [Comamonadaceae bacterium]|nr:hypothetical protein [Comamonadaceae bacterium]
MVVENIHRRAAASTTAAAGADHPARGRRGRRPDHPGHADGDRGAAADGLRQRADGPVHERRSRSTRQHGHAAVAGDRLRRHALAGAAAAAHGQAGAHAAPAERATSSPRWLARFFTRVMTPFLRGDARPAQPLAAGRGIGAGDRCCRWRWRR